MGIKEDKEKDKEAIMDDYFELVEELHLNMILIPQALQDKIWDMVYKRYEP